MEKDESIFRNERNVSHYDKYFGDRRCDETKASSFITRDRVSVWKKCTHLFMVVVYKRSNGQITSTRTYCTRNRWRLHDSLTVIIRVSAGKSRGTANGTRSNWDAANSNESVKFGRVHGVAPNKDERFVYSISRRSTDKRREKFFIVRMEERPRIP